MQLCPPALIGPFRSFHREVGKAVSHHQPPTKVQRCLVTNATEKRIKAELDREFPEQLPNVLSLASGTALRRAVKATGLHGQYRETGCNMLMLFADFKQQGVRNKIRKELGLQPIYLRGEANPAAPRRMRGGRRGSSRRR